MYNPYEIGFMNYVFQNSKTRTQAQLPIGNQSTAEEQLIYCDFILCNHHIHSYLMFSS